MTDILIGMHETIEDFMDIKGINICCSMMKKWIFITSTVKVSNIDGGNYFNPKIVMKVESEDHFVKIMELNYCPHCGKRTRIIHHISEVEFTKEKSTKAEKIGQQKFYKYGIRIDEVNREEKKSILP